MAFKPLTPKRFALSRRDADTWAALFILVLILVGAVAVCLSALAGSRVLVVASALGEVGLIAVVAMIRTGGR